MSAAVNDLAQVEKLTPREQEVLDLLADTGATNRELAQALNIEERTVEQHLVSIFKKLGVKRRGQAIVVARRGGMVELGRQY